MTSDPTSHLKLPPEPPVDKVEKTVQELNPDFSWGGA
ncbi:hypothetical protein CFELI_14150 [Corynebacterium felinum]|uniref:Uncharacterized protein n=1 Tax=Corynebacterium felinum TaxID=131318 RepID=A0ABU2B6J0_9CORY|nr:hypothetical protein [Corynebacterium felinum]WJY96401.1 hypothetical protein CFELI_14150 [Corynebacterium felinum]